MQAESFYQCHDDDAVPISLVSEAQWQAGELEVSSRERKQLINQQFTGKAGEFSLIYDDNGQLQKAFVGHNEDEIQAMCCAATLLPPGTYSLKHTISAVALSYWALAQYRYERYKKSEKKARVLVISEKKLAATVADAAAVFLVRDLINAPANDMGPEQLALTAQTLAQQFAADFKQWVGNELLSDNFPAIHAVGRASALTPRLLEITWGDKKHPLVTVIGKGVCFDCGGLDVKPASNMRLMKKDMGGAAHALGLAQWIMTKRIPIRLQVLIPAVENAIGPEAFRPGDVITMRNGLTVEIDNTDAEGRLILADAITKACEDDTSLIIDFATLTGAARIAVGTEIAAMFTPDDKLAETLRVIAEKINDPVWRLPLYAGYDCLLESKVADVLNASNLAYAGATTAALFLKRFITKDIPWIHFDIMAWNLSSKPGKPEGGEAMGMRTIAQYLLEKYK